jgi:FtsH-binding integral membrane protein
MAFGSPNPLPFGRTAAGAGDIDLGLRQHMLQVYNYMASGLAVTGAVAWLASDLGFYTSIGHSPLMFLVILAPVILVFALSAGINRMQYATAQALFWTYAALNGLSLGIIFLVYTKTSIAETFFITAGMFLSMSLYGYTTKTDLTKMGSFLMMGLWGIIIASVVNIFISSGPLSLLISVVGVVVFTGLTAWDTQAIKEQYYQVSAGEAAGKAALMGALRLYLDFINLFIMLLRLFGDRRS